MTQEQQIKKLKKQIKQMHKENLALAKRIFELEAAELPANPFEGMYQHLNTQPWPNTGVLNTSWGTGTCIGDMLNNLTVTYDFPATSSTALSPISKS